MPSFVQQNSFHICCESPHEQIKLIKTNSVKTNLPIKINSTILRQIGQNSATLRQIKIDSADQRQIKPIKTN